MQANKKILFVVGPALGHVGRSLVIARALSRISDVNIHFACVSPGNGEATIGVEFVNSNIIYNEKGGRKFAEKLEQIFELESPDLICLDITPVPWLYQVIFPSIPQVYITNFFLTILGKETTVQDLWMEKNKETCNADRLLRGLRPIENARELYERDVVLLADPIPFVSGLDDLPANYVPVGPCIWEPSSEIGGNLSSEQNILYISMGSSGHRTISQRLVEGLAAGINVKKIVWVGVRSAFAEECGVNYSYQFFDRLSASDVIPKAKLVITQGGAGSTYQALGYGVPVGIWPTHKNQEVLGSYIQKKGFGALLTADLPNSVTQLCTNIHSIKQNILDAGPTFSFGKAPDRAAKAILECIEICD